MTDSTVLLVHGLWHGAWSWDPVRAHLEDAGVASVAVELPMTSLEDDVQVVRDALDGMRSPVVLVGHSYGGAVITAAGEHPSVRRLAYIAAFQLAEGESIAKVRPDLDIAPTGLGGALRFSADRAWVSLDPIAGRDLLYPDVPGDVADASLARIRPVARDLFSAHLSAFAWRSVPSSYAICSADRTVAPELQRAMAERSESRVEWNCGHSPLASRPERVAEFLTGLD